MSVMVAERRFNGAKTGDGPVVKVKGSITKSISRLQASWEASCDEEDLEADIAKHIIEEYTELQKFEAQETTVLIVGGGVDRMTELEHFFPQMKLMIIELPSGGDDSHVCAGVKATNWFMPEKTLSEKGVGGGCSIVVNNYQQIKTRDGAVWGDDVFLDVVDCNHGRIGSPADWDKDGWWNLRACGQVVF